MSWSLSVHIEPGDLGNDVRGKLDAAFVGRAVYYTSGTAEKIERTYREIAGEQASRVIDAVLLLIGSVSRPQDGCFVVLSGHYNAGKEPVAGWSSCGINIHLTQQYPEIVPSDAESPAVA